MNEFVSSDLNTLPLRIAVLDSFGNVIRRYRAPANFQLDKYVLSLHPDATLKLTYPKTENEQSRCDVQAEVYINNVIMGMHTGVYVKPKPTPIVESKNEEPEPEVEVPKKAASKKTIASKKAPVKKAAPSTK